VIKKAKKALKALFSLMLLGDIDLRFADESAFCLTSNVPYGWIRVGEQHGISSSKHGKLNVFGLLNYQGELTSYTTTQRVDSAQIIEWMEDFINTMKQKTVVVMDNAPWHTSVLMTAKIIEWKSRGLEIFFLPPYCPHLNIIEVLWRKMKHEWLRPQDFNEKLALHDRIDAILDNYGDDLFDIEFDLDQMLS
jgi:transposase